MAKSKKSPKSSRSAKPSKAKKAKAGRVRLPVLDALMGPLTGKGKRGRKAGAKSSAAERVAAQLAAADDAGMGRPRHVNKAAAPAKLPSMLTDPRLPAVGTEIVRTYKDRAYRVTRLEDRFTFEGRDYPSLSKIAREIIGGAQVNGFAFFGLVPKAEAKSSG